MPQPHIVFLPGAGGSPLFWEPLGTALPAAWRKTYLGWPGLGHEPHDPKIESLDDLVTLAGHAIDGPCVIAAQSMGGLVAVRLALKHPDKIRGLVLTVTSGGIDLKPHSAFDWRLAYAQEYPNAAPWIFTIQSDHSADLKRITAPTLLIWGDADPISPISVGRELAQILPAAELHIVKDGTHDLVREMVDDVAPLIQRHVKRLGY